LLAPRAPGGAAGPLCMAALRARARNGAWGDRDQAARQQGGRQQPAAQPRAVESARLLQQRRASRAGKGRIIRVIGAKRPWVPALGGRGINSQPTGRSSAMTLPLFGRLPGATSFTWPLILVTDCSVAAKTSAKPEVADAHSA